MTRAWNVARGFERLARDLQIPVHASLRSSSRPARTRPATNPWGV